VSQLIARVRGEAVSVPVDVYPDGAPLIDFPRDTEVTRILVRPSTFAGFMAAMFFVDALAARGHAVPELILPLVPGSRQDRLNPSGDYLFTARSVAAVINARRFPSVTVLDPHSDVTPALIDRCHVIAAAECLFSYTSGLAAVVSPDGGAEKRASAVARALRVPLLHAWKTRSVETGALSGFGLQPTDIRERRVLVVDDICDGGGTFIGIADELDRAGLKADLFVTHGIFSKGTKALLERFRHIFTTDSVLGERHGVDVNRICERLFTKETS
jgi:ribose-phosphate pyrophosphokinase